MPLLPPRVPGALAGSSGAAAGQAVNEQPSGKRHKADLAAVTSSGSQEVAGTEDTQADATSSEDAAAAAAATAKRGDEPSVSISDAAGSDGGGGDDLDLEAAYEVQQQREEQQQQQEPPADGELDAATLAALEKLNSRLVGWHKAGGVEGWMEGGSGAKAWVHCMQRTSSCASLRG